MLLQSLSLLLTLSLTSCAVDWKKLGANVGQATVDAAIPIIADTVTSKPTGK